MKCLREYNHSDEEYVELYDFAHDKQKPFLVYTKIEGHVHEVYFKSFTDACIGFNAAVKVVSGNIWN